MDFREHIAGLIHLEGIPDAEIAANLVEAQDRTKADYALPCFRFSRILKKAPAQIAEGLAAAIPADEYVSEVSAVNGYLNFRVDKGKLAEDVLERVLAEGERYGASREGEGRTICIDFSSVNIAKPFHIGHLSTTVIGAALYRIFGFLGYRVVGINHLGDWGTQFGKLIAAFKKWGDREEIEREGIRALLKIYVRFHEEAEKDPALDDEARMWFKRIEDGDPGALELFDWFKRITLAEVQRVYDMLGVRFDSYAGESFYNDKMAPVLEELREKRLLKESEGALVVDLEEYGMPPCLLVKADGATLYATRDLAAAEYRKKTYDFDKCLYVVAYQQNLHFKQFFKVLELMDKPWAKDLVHVAFGMVSLEGEALSTRKGNVVFLEDVINRCVAQALEIISRKSPDLEKKEEVANVVGIGAVVFSALHANRIKDVSFCYDRVLNFDGETGPYVQYTYARCNSVLAKGAITRADYGKIDEAETDLVMLLAAFPNVVRDAARLYEPSMITRHMVEIAKRYNKFYYDHRILGEDPGVQSLRLTLTKATMTVLRTGLGLLGIRVPDKM